MDMNNKIMEVKVKLEIKCNICEHVPKYAKDLQKHKKIVHDKILDYKCQFCEMKCSNRGYLKQHTQSIHAGVTPFQCNVCGRQFRKISTGETHSNTQT